MKGGRGEWSRYREEAEGERGMDVGRRAKKEGYGARGRQDKNRNRAGEGEAGEQGNGRLEKGGSRVRGGGKGRDKKGRQILGGRE